MSLRPFVLVLLVACFAMGACRPRGTSTPEELGAVGASCEVDDECRSGLTCVLWAPDLPILGGRCSRACTIDGDCPSGARCGPLQLTGSGFATFCLEPCDRTGDVAVECDNPEDLCEFDGVCRPYRCTDGSVCDSGACDRRSGECVVGATPTARVGDDCTVDDDCRAPAGTCLGECYQDDCDRGGEFACASGETCAAYATEGAYDSLSYACERACEPGVDAAAPNNGGACRDGEVCIPPEVDPGGLRTTGRCTRLDQGYPLGRAGAQIGDPCATVDDCPNPFGYGRCVDGLCVLAFCATSAFGGVDPCAPAMRCVTAVPPGQYSREARALLAGGICLFRCDGAGCPTGYVCDTATTSCQADCRPDPAICPALTSCGEDGVCR